MAVITLTKTDVGRNLFRDAAHGIKLPTITYFALGDGNLTPSADNTRLQHEMFRKNITSFANGVTGELIINVYVAPSDAVGINIAEVGVFATTSATSDANTGLLVGRGLYSHPNKLNTESIVLQLSLQF